MTVVYLDRRNILLSLAALTGCFIIGILIGTFGIFESSSTDSNSNLQKAFRNGKSITDDNALWANILVDLILIH